jgi:hypothetical protein
MQLEGVRVNVVLKYRTIGWAYGVMDGQEGFNIRFVLLFPF